MPFHAAFIAAGALAVLGIFLSLLLDNKEATRATRQRADARPSGREAVAAR